MAIGDIVSIVIEGIAAGGAGVGRVEGRTCFVDFTAPGETVVARIAEEKGSWSTATLLEVRTPSEERTEPACPYYGSCGGCNLQHLAYDAQLRAKERILADAFGRIGRFEALPPIATTPSPPIEYRNRMQFHRVPPELPQGTKVALMDRKGKRLPIEDCPIADPALREALRAGSLVPPPWADRFHVYSRAETFLVEGGVERGRTVVLGKPLNLDVRGFFQSNGRVLESLLIRVMEVAEEVAPRGSGRAVDLYCGVGTFGTFLADRFERLDLVERDRNALALARENVRGSGLRHFALSDDDWARRAEAKEGRYDLAVVDPPRTGLSAALRSWLVARPPRRLVYVSCDAATLARDARELAAGGFLLQELSFFDFYPQTAHLEALAVFGGRE